MKKVFIPLILILLILSLSISAAATSAPTTPYLSGGIASWGGSADAVYYIVELYKDGGFVTSVTTSSTAYDFNSTIQSSGDGSYYFEVCAAADSSAGGNSEYVQSNTDFYGSVTCSHSLYYYSFSYPTCTEKGDKGHYECEKCGKWFWDNAATAEIIDHDDAFSDAIGHDWGEWKIIKQPTTDAEGEAQRVCANDSSHVETTSIPKLKSSDDKPVIPTDDSDETTSETIAEKPTKSKETTAKTTPTTAPTEYQPITIATRGGSFFGNLLASLGGSLLLWIIIFAVVLFLVIPGVIILIVVLVKKSKNKK
ncbi:MAG: hypothetical protein IJV48_01955 [Ruminococcus sp.]|nr:hypothetical protein [Ruminococcus sp.]